MTSKPLFIRVAESIVIRFPIFQVGCFSACAGVKVANWSAGVLRNGPPDAVSNKPRDLASLTGAKALVGTVVFAIYRDEFRPGFLRTALITNAPAETSDSLLARPILFPD